MLYRICELVIDITPRFKYVPFLMQDYLVSEGKPDITIKFTDEELKQGVIDYQEENVAYVETLMVLKVLSEYLLKNKLGMIFHCSAISYKGNGILFAAPSGTGKSTHARMWKEKFKDDVVYVNDDKPMIRVCGDEFYCYGSPWDGKHRLSTNTKAPIKVICFLEQAKKNEIEELSPIIAVPLLMKQTLRPETIEDMDKLCELLTKLLASVKIFKLKCDMSSEALETSFTKIKGVL